MRACIGEHRPVRSEVRSGESVCWLLIFLFHSSTPDLPDRQHLHQRTCGNPLPTPSRGTRYCLNSHPPMCCSRGNGANLSRAGAGPRNAGCCRMKQAGRGQWFNCCAATQAVCHYASFMPRKGQPPIVPPLLPKHCNGWSARHVPNARYGSRWMETDGPRNPPMLNRTSTICAACCARWAGITRPIKCNFATRCTRTCATRTRNCWRT